MEWKYVKATTSEKIEAVKKKYDVQLPEDLEKLILKSNNGRPVKATFDSERTRGLEFKKLLSYNTEDMENIYTFIDVVQTENRNLFPIASEPSGDFICLDLSKNAVVHLNHETATTEFVADSISQLISALY